ncbi:NmrA family NAD(P)-binding protein [Rhizobium calliandrae]|uniref:NmrA family NAD(P)-binding protein n=1 Tax=Rhizobium calliandrae TaxID=1312182 RepID=A0ABT7KF64_9HYPH|nr:NmrA family NAD(P)-binding protein [Rhizobium calliandrae]MDL2406832.1 NmrA family NAD(P)-binding protein [Rhizobium calliandrae]
MSKKYLITGATGKTGKHTMKALLDKGHSVRALVHKEDERADALRKAGAEVVVGDLVEHDDVRRALEGTTAAYFCYPVVPRLVDASAYFAEAAKRAGVELIVNMSQISAREVAKSHAARDHWISERVFDWSGVPTAHIRPTFFSEWLTFPWVRDVIVNEGLIELPYGEGHHAPISGEDQARFIAALLENPAEHAGKTYPLYGPVELSQAEIAEKLSTFIEKKIVYRPTTIEGYEARLRSYNLPAHITQHFLCIAIDYQNGVFAGTDGAIGQVTGKAPETVEEFLAKNRGAFVASA